MRVANPQVMRAADMNVAVARPVAAQAVTTRPCAPQHGGCHSVAAAVCSRHRANRSFASPPPSSQPATPDDAIYILAFICKALPKSPDPDLTLQW